MRLKYINNIEKKLNLETCQGDKINTTAQNFKAFPFVSVNYRVQGILQKYHEKPNLLAKISEFIIKEVMDVIKGVLNEFTSRKAELILNKGNETDEQNEGSA